MPKRYKIETPDGKTITVEGPDDATDEELVAFVRQQASAMGDYAHSPVHKNPEQVEAGTVPDLPTNLRPTVRRNVDALAGTIGQPGLGVLMQQGASFGFSDEIAGGVNALGNILTSPFTGNLHPRQAYYDGRDTERARIDQAQRESPMLGTLAEFVGGMAGGVPRAGAAALAAVPDALAAIRSGAKGGAAVGALSGFGTGNDTGTSIAGGVLGGAFGGVLGAAVPTVALGVANRAQGLSRLLGRDQPSVARQVVGQALAADANTGAEAGALMDRAHSLGVPFMLADTGENARGLVASVGRQPGASRTTVLNAVQERQMGQGDRIRSAIERDLGPITNGFDQADALMAGARERAGPLYDAAYAQPGRTSDELQSLLETPTGRSALSRAYRIAADERRDPATLGLIMDADGNVRLNPAPVRQEAGVEQARADLDAAQDAYRQVRGTAGGGTVSQASDRVMAARENLRQAEQQLSAAPAEGSEQSAPAFTVQTLDYVKRGIDDVLNEKKNAFGQLQLDEAGRAVEGVRRQFVSEVDRLHPGPYQEARLVYAGPAAARDALEAGGEALNKSPQDISRQLSYYGDNERDMFAQGYRNTLAGSIERRVDDADKARAVLGTPAKRAALAEVFPTGLDQFGETLAAEQATNQTFRAATQGPQTAERLVYDAQTADPGLEETVLDSALRGSRDGLWPTIISGLQKIRDVERYGYGEAGKSVRQSVASLLTETDPAELHRILAEANEQVLRQRESGRVVAAGGADFGRRLSQGVAVAAGNSGGR